MHPDFRRCLDEMDVGGMRRLASIVGQREMSVEHTTIAMHYARTQAESIAFEKRAWSHAWLSERGFPSGLPDELRPRADRIYPRVVEAVGVAVKPMSEASIPLAKAIERAMSDAVAECYADGVRDPLIIRARMAEARCKVMA